MTVNDVAKAAGVSPSTAARVLRGKGGRAKNIARVQKAAIKLGYVRNQQAASLRSGKSHLIGLILPDIANACFPPFFQAVHDAALAKGYQVLFHNTFGSAVEEEIALKMLEMNQVAGIIVDACVGETDDACDVIIRRLASKGIAIILAGRPARKLPMDRIITDNVTAVSKAMTYLARLGHTRIAFLNGPRNAMAAAERYEGYKLGLRMTKLKYVSNLVSYGAFTMESGYSQAKKLLKLSQAPTALVAGNDMMAIGAISAIKKTGARVPEDVAVIGFDDIPMAQYCCPALTTLRQPQRRIATDAVEHLVEKIKHPQLPQTKLEYEPELIIRESA